MLTDDDIVKKYREFVFMKLDLTPDEVRSKTKQYPSGNELLLNCGRHLDLFKAEKVIPQYCFGCYKVLIAPRNVLELFKLMDVFNDPEFPVENNRKCMVEERPYVSGFYKGYIYCDGYQQADAVKKLVRKFVTNRISPQVAVSVTHGCSEYAKVYPQFAKLTPAGSVMKYKPEWQQVEEQFDSQFIYTRVPDDPNDLSLYYAADTVSTCTRRQIHCMQYWLQYAATVGDTSYLHMTGRPIPQLPIPAVQAREKFKNLIPVKSIK